MTDDLAIAGLDAEKVEHYLKLVLGKDIAVVNLTHLGKPPDEALGKSYGFGVPIRVECRAGNSWYPRLAESVRRKLLTFLFGVLETPAFDPTQVNEYCGA